MQNKSVLEEIIDQLDLPERVVGKIVQRYKCWENGLVEIIVLLKSKNKHTSSRFFCISTVQGTLSAPLKP